MRRVLPIIAATAIALGLGIATRGVWAPEHFPTGDAVASARVEDMIALVSKENRNTATLIFSSGEIREASGTFFPEAGSLMRIDGDVDPATGAIAVTRRDIAESDPFVIDSPSPGATVASPIVVTGFSRDPSYIPWRILDASGLEAGSGAIAGAEPVVGAPGPFRLEAFVPALEGTDFTLELGEGDEAARLPLRLLKREPEMFSVYFRPAAFGACDARVERERSIASTSALARASVATLLEGPTQEESELGFGTAIPDGVAIESLVISSGVAKLQLVGASPGGLDPCAREGMRMQLRRTLLQFPDIHDVEILIEGAAF